jgi:hypothetical protein
MLKEVQCQEVCLPELGEEGRCRDGTSCRASVGNEEEERREEEYKEGESVKGAYIWAVRSIQGPENVTEAIAHSQISGN